jgi:phosphoribosylanthranilate isomerase
MILSVLSVAILFMTKVKICGITNLEDALLSADFGADALGFNFYPGSTRYIDEGRAESIVERLTKPILKVGIFVNQTIEDIIDAEGIAELDLLQLHGNESPAFVTELRTRTDAKIIKAFRVGPDFDVKTVNEYRVDGVLLDSFSGHVWGGSGESFDWKTAKAVRDLVPELYLAGGLSPENVAEAIATVHPYAVDVASRVESTPGKKDPKKLEAFIRNAKGV